MKIMCNVNILTNNIRLSGSGSINCPSFGVIQWFLFYFEILSVSYFPFPVKRYPSGVLFPHLKKAYVKCKFKL